MYKRQICKALTHKDVHDLSDVEHFAETIGKQLNTRITIHPKFLNRYPDDIGTWLSTFFLNKLRDWCVRRDFGYFALWVRENYEGEHHEHVHLMLHVPERHRSDLEAALRRWLPGDDGVLDVGRPTFKKDSFGRSVNQFLTYILKQMTPQAWWALGKEVRRETHSSLTGLPVAAVLGKRWGVSRTLDKAARQAFWERRSSAPRQTDPGERTAAGAGA
jgi:hypothetical protein